MQTMNTDQAPYYPNLTGPHQPATGYYIPNGTDPQYSIRNPNTYVRTAHIPQQFYHTPMPNAFGPQTVYVPQPYMQHAPFPHANGPPGMNPSSVPIIRPPNENLNGSQNFISQTPYSTYSQPPTTYNPQQYPSYQTSYHYTQPTSPSQISNQSQLQYPGTTSHQQMQSAQTSQQSSFDQQHGQSSQSSYSKDKRERKPLAIVDPVSHEPVKLETSTPVINASSTIPTTDDTATDPTITNPKSTEEINETQKKQAEFRQQFARLLNNSNVQTDNSSNQSSTEETTTKENPTEDPIPQSTSPALSRSDSISNQSSEQLQPSYSDSSNRRITDDKSDTETNEDDLQHHPSDSPIETASNSSKSASDDTTNEVGNQLSPTESLENVTPTQSNDTEAEAEAITNEKSSSISKRHGYTIEELRSKRFGLVSQERPKQLKDIPGITTPKESVKPKVDGNQKFERDVRSILNKVTPQMYDKLLQQLDELELNNAERLEGLITIMFTKAVEAAIFCSLYAEICKHFQKKQVTVPDENGQPVTYIFRQMLLQRCQKEFENDYRQDIDYEKRLTEVKAIEDEKTRKDAAEQLEEDLLKAKRKKLGNIIFIGELFKLQMLTDTIMYDCIDYLLRDKTDEESLECLYRLLLTIGKELDAKAGDKTPNRKLLEKYYVELVNIVKQRVTSARIRFLIEEVLEMRKVNWVARRVIAKPTTIDKIHEQERLRQEQQERERPPRQNQNRSGGGPPQYAESRGSRGSGGQQQYTESRGSRGSGVRQQSNRIDDDRNDNRVIVNSLRQIQSNDKRNSGAGLNLAPQRPWAKGSGVEKKVDDDRPNTARTTKPPVGSNPQFRPKTGPFPGTPGYPTQRQSSRELARENSPRDREKAMESLRQTASPSEKTSPTSPSIISPPESSHDVSREESRTASRESSVSERTLPTNTTSTTTTTTGIVTSFDEEKTQARVHSLIEEYTENYSDNTDRPVNEAIEDLSSFCTPNLDQQAIVVRELFTNVLEAKPRARKAVGHLLDAALQKNIITTEGFLSGIKIFIEVVPDYAVDIPRIWQYIGEIIGAFIGASSLNMILLKTVLQSIPDVNSKQLFQDIIRYAVEFSSETRVQMAWQSAGFTLNDLIQSESSFYDEYNWLTEPTKSEITPPIKETVSPHADPQLVKLFKSINEQSSTVNDEQILSYIQQNMNSNEKFYIRNIVLSYLEACLINREPQKKIQEDIARQRMTVLNAIIEQSPEKEIQAVYAIQNFVNKLEHPPKMARLLFDIFYDEECVTEQGFLEWLNHPDQCEMEGHSVVEISTKDFFVWLQEAEPEAEDEEE